MRASAVSSARCAPSALPTGAVRSRFPISSTTWLTASPTRCGLPATDFPRHPVPPDAALAAAEDCAARVRVAWGLAPGPVPDVVAALERHGIVCARYHVGTHTVDAFSVPFPDRPVVILGDDKAKRDRERFSAAHELGHLVMHDPEHAGTKMIEAQAHRFAAAFLMPSGDIHAELPAHRGVESACSAETPLGGLDRRIADARKDTRHHAGKHLPAGRPLHGHARMARRRTRRPRRRRSTTTALSCRRARGDHSHGTVN